MRRRRRSPSASAIGNSSRATLPERFSNTAKRSSCRTTTRKHITGWRLRSSGRAHVARRNARSIRHARSPRICNRRLACAENAMEFGYRRPWFLRCLLTPIVYTPLVVVGMLFTITSRAREAADFSFTDAAKTAGLNQFTVYGGTRTNRYLLETTGGGVAGIEVHGDAWQRVLPVQRTR